MFEDVDYENYRMRELADRLHHTELANVVLQIKAARSLSVAEQQVARHLHDVLEEALARRKQPTLPMPHVLTRKDDAMRREIKLRCTCGWASVLDADRLHLDPQLLDKVWLAHLQQVNPNHVTPVQ